MSSRDGLPSPEHVLEMFYHRELGYGLHDGNDHAWTFHSAFKALEVQVTDAEVARYRDYFIEHGFGKFDGVTDPGFRISPHGEAVARISIAKRQPWYSPRRIKTYDWSLIGGVAAIVAAVFAFIDLIASK